ncbi:hypothetical protein [Pelagibacterium xiamenense]|uniref:hypothetical protein n=1 Tax=Pelagibacterium xiamenense TaxID=2901140 RepID=UPI001E2B7E9C|nr:hypothetical protein [Pelagibacterium xiamenense]MCD7059116.1 hypothetical protein [Pelagibacterium xiamenense]
MVEVPEQSNQPIAEAGKSTVDAANPLLDLLSQVLAEVWAVVAAAVLGAIGWFGKSAFDGWQKSRLPYKQDRDRYQAVIEAVDPAHLHYFKETPLNLIGSRAVDGIDDGYEAMSSIRKSRPIYLHRKLLPLEEELFLALGELCNFLPKKLFPHRMNAHVYTMYWDQFDEWSDEHNRRFMAIKDELFQKIDRSIRAYEAYRDAGNRLFADRLVKEKPGG